MESLLKIQYNNKTIIEKGLINFKKSPKDRLTQAYITTRLETLEANWKEFIQTNRTIVGQATEADLKSNVYFTSNLYETTEEIYFSYKSELKELCQNTQVSSKDNMSSINVKLPKITLPTFSGSYSEWVSFRDLFLSLIHKNESLDEVQKIHYLKGHLTGEAEQLLRHTPATASNYEECWSTLVKRYNNKKFIANSTVQRLIKQPAVIKETSSNIKALLDNTVECLHCLQSLGIDIKSWDLIVISIISEKLDKESRRLWEASTSSSEEIPKVDEFKTFLESRFRSLEYLDTKMESSNTSVRAKDVKSFNVTSQSCVLCSDNHKLYQCKKFTNMSCNERREFTRASKLCFNCLGRNHSVYNCRQRMKCQICHRKHHSLLHIDEPDRTAVSTTDSAKGSSVTAAVVTSTPNESTQRVEDSPTCCFGQKDLSHGLLATALVHVGSTRTGHNEVLRALMDQGSQVSFITEAAVQFLGLQKTQTHTNVHGIGDDEGKSVPSRYIVKFKLQSRLCPNFSSYVEALVLKKITNPLPDRRIAKVPPAIENLDLADPSFHTPGKIDLLLGTCVLSEILLDGVVKGAPGTPVAQRTKLGWIVSGEVQSSAFSRPLCFHTAVQVNDLLKQFWELEAEPSGNNSMLTEEEQKCEAFYSKTTRRDVTGRYIVKLPFKTDQPSCASGGSEVIARRRFINLEKRLSKEPKLKTQYSAVLNEYLQLGHAEVVPQVELGNDAFYLPHHAVVREDKTTTKVRVVFDASCSGHNNTSLNKELMVGPTLQPDLRSTIMRWRCHPISLVADIVKMYRQVKVADEDINYQRILWRDHSDSEIKHLRLLRVTFGTSCAPYLAVRSLQQLAHDEGKDFPLVADRVLTDFYVDDLLTGCQSVAEGEQIYHQLTELLSRGGFELQKWSSNSEELIKIISSTTVDHDQLELGIENVSKILGLSYNRKSDEFTYSINLPPPEIPITKRKVISDIARLFDPLGWLAPVIITAKVFIQRLWLNGSEWDDELPDHLVKEWLNFRNNLHALKEFRLPRWINTSQNDVLLELHGFSDASNLAYSAVVYIRCINSDGRIQVSLVASKTKVAPVKQVSIPRLELCGAVLLSKLLREVSATLDIYKGNVHAWTDSTVVLAWLSSHPSRWKTFVGNRVSEILTGMDSSQWSHVQGKDNPADCASRGINPSECATLKLWIQGPKWLSDKEINYSKREIKETDLEQRKSENVCYVAISQPLKLDVWTKYSSLRKLIRVIAYCRRFGLHKRSNSELLSSMLTVKELNEALVVCIKQCQHEHFSKELEDLAKIANVQKRSVLASLNPFVDQGGILRVGGRLEKATLNNDSRHPIIIPAKSHLTDLLIADAHLKTLHGGPQLMLNQLRSKYWVLNAKNRIKLYVRKCVICLRHAARTKVQLMGQLPKARVTANRPFHQTGVDYAGPIHMRTSKGRGHHSYKGYICLFVCMATRAVHLEAVSDLTSKGFLAAFKRFVARRGQCVDLYSDNGTNFVGAAKELKELLAAENSSVRTEIAEWLSNNGTNWHFIPPRAPNFGGLWEAGIKSTKHHLKRIVGNSTLTYEEMATVLSQIEACLNSRPISQISENSQDPIPLTPGHFLVGEPLLLVPDQNYERSTLTNLKRWQLTQRMVQDFWRRWSKEYLTQFMNRYKWAYQIPEPAVGNIVLVKEDDLPPARWLYGIIVEKHVGSDNLTRVVSLRCNGSVIKRPVSKLIVLPIE